MERTAPTPDLEFWRVSPPRLGIGAQARRIEEQGWDGMTAGDSQSLAPDPYIVLARAIETTSTLKLSTWVTNPVTRHASVAASALATLQAESGGRIEMGIGRGDSALAYIGLAPAPLKHFEAYLRQLRGYLNGEDVPLVDSDAPRGMRSVEDLDMGRRPTSNRLKWLPEGHAPVPVVVAASGPKVMHVAGRVADTVVAVVGPTRERLAWAREEIVSVPAGDRIPGAGPALGTSVVVAVHEDREVARRMVRPVVTVQARFAAMHGGVNGPADDDLARDLTQLREHYDMNRHAGQGASQSALLSDRIIDNFSVAGPPGEVAERLAEMAELGFRRFTLSVEAPDVDESLVLASEQLLASRVLPEVRRSLAPSRG